MKTKCLFFLTINLLLINCSNSQNIDNKSKNNNVIIYEEQKLNSPTRNKEARNYYNNGYSEFSKNNYKTAIKYYKMAIQIDSNYTDAIDNCALSYRRLNILDSAVFYYKLSLSKLPTNELAWNNLALVYVNNNEFTLAKEAYKKIIQLNPKNADGPYGLSEIYLKENNNDSAIIYSINAYELWEDNNPPYAGDAAYYAGLAYLKKGDKKKAKEYFDKAKSLGRILSPQIEKAISQ
jgi:tetratricopeptide (TPR) repeat protein